MSGLLARLAARAAGATGATPSALPQLPARFEPAVVSVAAPTDLETPAMHEAPSAEHPTAWSRDEVRPPPQRPGRRLAGRRLPVESSTEQGDLVPVAWTGPTPAPAATHAALRAAESSAEPVAGHPTEARGPATEPGSAGREGQPEAQPHPATTVTAVPAVAAKPVPTLRSEDHEVPREPSSETVVRISIGRVDVRANVAAPSPPPRPAAAVNEKAPEPALQLHDYLRGKRDVR